MPLSSFQIGTSLVGMVNIESLTTPLPVPRAPFNPYARLVMASSGRSIGQGLATCQWIFSRLTPDQRQQLRGFCAGSSATVYIITMTNEADVGHSVASDAYMPFRGVMHWPEEKREPSRLHDRLEFTITFTHLVPL